MRLWEPIVTIHVGAHTRVLHAAERERSSSGNAGNEGLANGCNQTSTVAVRTANQLSLLLCASESTVEPLLCAHVYGFIQVIVAAHNMLALGA